MRAADLLGRHTPHRKPTDLENREIGDQTGVLDVDPNDAPLVRIVDDNAGR